MVRWTSSSCGWMWLCLRALLLGARGNHCRIYLPQSVVNTCENWKLQITADMGFSRKENPSAVRHFLWGFYPILTLWRFQSQWIPKGSQPPTSPDSSLVKWTRTRWFCCRSTGTSSGTLHALLACAASRRVTLIWFGWVEECWRDHIPKPMFHVWTIYQHFRP